MHVHQTRFSACAVLTEGDVRWQTLSRRPSIRSTCILFARNAGVEVATHLVLEQSSRDRGDNLLLILDAAMDRRDKGCDRDHSLPDSDRGLCAHQIGAGYVKLGPCCYDEPHILRISPASRALD